jgi:ribosomal protein S13
MPKHAQKKAIKKVMSKPKPKPSKPIRGQRTATNKKKKGSK